jgi:hypothetical protein
LLTYAPDAALLQTAQVHGLPKPVECDMAFLREWLERPHGGDYFLKGLEGDPWDQEYSADLVVLSGSQSEQDRFAQYMSDKIVPLYHRYIGHRMKKPVPDKDWSAVWEYKSETFVALGNIICMILSSIIPTASILCLCFVRTMVVRLAVISGMSLIFSFVMVVIVQGRRVEVFAATTAFAAVQVVFVGGTNFIPVSS